MTPGTLALTALTMTFFAANSLLARLALRAGAIDGVSFTAVRLFAGAVTLALLLAFRRDGIRALRTNGSVPAALALFAYAIAFSFAYTALDAGTGALILFAAVQMTMLSVAIARGERLPPIVWIGLAVAFGGLIYLVSPGLSAPAPVGAALMAAAGAFWGAYSLAARGVRSPTAATAGNFVRATPLAAAALLVYWATGRIHTSTAGVGFAALSGAITSGLGYIFWYLALEKLPSSRAAIVQLTVPVIAAIAGILILGEQPSWRLAFASTAILGGVAIALIPRMN